MKDIITAKLFLPFFAICGAIIRAVRHGEQFKKKSVQELYRPIAEKSIDGFIAGLLFVVALDFIDDIYPQIQFTFLTKIFIAVLFGYFNFSIITSCEKIIKMTPSAVRKWLGI